MLKYPLLGLIKMYLVCNIILACTVIIKIRAHYDTFQFRATELSCQRFEHKIHAVMRSELQIRESIENNSKIIFLISQ